MPRKIQLYVSGQVDKVMQQELENLRLAVDGEGSGKQKKGKKSEKVRAASVRIQSKDQFSAQIHL